MWFLDARFVLCIFQVATRSIDGVEFNIREWSVSILKCSVSPGVNRQIKNIIFFFFDGGVVVCNFIIIGSKNSVKRMLREQLIPQYFIEWTKQLKISFSSWKRKWNFRFSFLFEAMNFQRTLTQPDKRGINLFLQTNILIIITRSRSRIFGWRDANLIVMMIMAAMRNLPCLWRLHAWEWICRSVWLLRENGSHYYYSAQHGINRQQLDQPDEAWWCLLVWFFFVETESARAHPRLQDAFVFQVNDSRFMRFFFVFLFIQIGFVWELWWRRRIRFSPVVVIVCVICSHYQYYVAAEPKRCIFSWQAICRIDFSCKWYNRSDLQSKNWMRMLHTIRIRPQFSISLFGCTLRKSVAPNFLHADEKFAVRYFRRPPFSHISRQTRARFSAYIIFVSVFIHNQSLIFLLATAAMNVR